MRPSISDDREKGVAAVTVPTFFHVSVTIIFDIPPLFFDFYLHMPNILPTFAAVRG